MAKSYPFRRGSEPLTEDQKLTRKKVLHEITAEPRSFYMGAWERHWDAGQQQRYNLCGTTRCLAGWALHVNGLPVNDGPGIIPQACELLGLSRAEYYGGGSGELFFDSETSAMRRMRALAGEEECDGQVRW